MARKRKQTAARTAQTTATASRQRRKLHLPHPVRALRAHKAVAGRVALIVLALVICVIPVIFINNAISYIPLIAFVAIIAISYIYLRLLVRALSFSEESLLPSCERGSEIEFVVNFKNASPLVFLRLEPSFYISDLFDGNDVLIPATTPLMPRETRDFRFEARFDHIGAYSAGVHKVVVFDLLGLFSKTILNENRHRVDVLPRLFDVSRIDLDNVSVQESQKAFQPIVTDDMDYAGVREYVPGDPLKTIHWKLSSRNTNGEYYTRLFETFGNPGISIIMDDTAPAYGTEDLMQVFDGVVESALSVNNYAREMGVDSELVYRNREGEAIKAHLLSLEDAPGIIEAIPRITVDEGRDCLELLQREGNSIHSQGNIAFCTAHLNEEIVSTLLEIKLHGRNPLLFLVVPSSLEGDERKEFLKPLRRLETAQVTCYVVSSAQDLSKEARS